MNRCGGSNATVANRCGLFQWQQSRRSSLYMNGRAKLWPSSPWTNNDIGSGQKERATKPIAYKHFKRKRSPVNGRSITSVAKYFQVLNLLTLPVWSRRQGNSKGSNNASLVTMLIVTSSCPRTLGKNVQIHSPAATQPKAFVCAAIVSRYPSSRYKYTLCAFPFFFLFHYLSPTVGVVTALHNRRSLRAHAATSEFFPRHRSHLDE